MSLGGMGSFDWQVNVQQLPRGASATVHKYRSKYGGLLEDENRKLKSCWPNRFWSEALFGCRRTHVTIARDEFEVNQSLRNRDPRGPRKLDNGEANYREEKLQLRHRWG